MFGESLPQKDLDCFMGVFETVVCEKLGKVARKFGEENIICIMHNMEIWYNGGRKNLFSKLLFC